METKKFRRACGCIAAAGVIFASAADAVATDVPTVALNTPVMLVKESLDGKVGRETGAGVMMTSLTQMAGNKVMAVWMDSDVKVRDSGWQGKIAVVQLNATTAPTLLVPPTQITDYAGERPFNHAAIAADATGMYALINFASTKDSPDNTRQFVMAVDSNGKPITDPLDIDAGNDGDNHGAASVYYLGKNSAGESTFIAGYQHNNNDSHVAGVTLHVTNGAVTLEQTFNTEFFRPTNIGRPECAVNGDGTATCCTEVGDNRPPETGIGCAVIDGQGNVVTKKIVAASVPDKKIYMNQVTIAPLGNGMHALGIVQSNGAGRNNNRLGNNTSLAYTIDAKTLAVISQTSSAQGVAPWQRHSTLITTLHNNAGETYIAHLGCSSTGAGSAAMQMVPVDSKGMIGTIDKVNELMPVSWACDGAKLANKGLRNPNDQGREFVRVIGNVPNPGFMVAGGFLPEASHFTIAAIPMARNAVGGGDVTSSNNGAYHGDAGEGGGGGGGGDGGPSIELQRNSLNFSFIPTAWSPKVQVVMNAALDVSQVKTGWAQCIANCGNLGDPSNPYSPHNKNNSGYQPYDNFGTSNSGCACTTAPGAGWTGLGGAALVGLALSLGMARRKRS